MDRVGEGKQEVRDCVCVCVCVCVLRVEGEGVSWSSEAPVPMKGFSMDENRC